MRFVARRVDDGGWAALTIIDTTIARVEPVGPEPGPTTWIAPAFWDIQVNGRFGVSFSDPGLTVEQVGSIARAQAGLGTARFCPTLITAPREATIHGLETIDRACSSDPDLGRLVLGVHLEGPWISPIDGYRGAHPLGSVRPPGWDEYRRFRDASGDRISLVTLAPEVPGAIRFVERLVAEGVVVAIGHSAADSETIRRAVDAGATLSTHLGNGIASPLPRHPNPITDQAGEDRLAASLIADGDHLDRSTLRVLLRAKRGNALLVSDASPLAGLPPGRHREWEVEPSGRIVVAGTPYLAGSGRGLAYAVGEVLATEPGVDPADVLAMAAARPARLLGRNSPSLAAGEPANLIRFGLDGGFRLLETCVDGRWTEAASNDETPPPATAEDGVS